MGLITSNESTPGLVGRISADPNTLWTECNLRIDRKFVHYSFGTGPLGFGNHTQGTQGTSCFKDTSGRLLVDKKENQGKLVAVCVKSMNEET